MNHDDLEVISKESLYKGYASVERVTLKHKLFAGGWCEPYQYELLVRYNAVAVLPYDPKLDKVVLIEQFRIGAINEKRSPWLLEIVAGVIDKNHSKEEIARLEAKEEAGLEVKKLIPIYDYLSSPGGSSENVMLYIALVDADKASGIHGLDEENEDIKVHVLTCQEAFAAVRSSKIRNAASIIAIQWLELNKDKI